MQRGHGRSRHATAVAGALGRVVRIVLCCSMVTGMGVSAQARPDSAARAPAPSGTGPARGAAPAAPAFLRPRPPLSSRNAFLLSLAVPGLAQARLDRPTAGAFFTLIEFGAFAMARRSQVDLAEARRFQAQAVRRQWTIDTLTGQPARVAGDSVQRGLARELVRSRRVHYEDWIAALVFNHLFSGADAFVAAQLWDVDATLGVVPMPRGAAVVASLRW
jgi:hypothetical protein